MRNDSQMLKWCESHRVVTQSAPNTHLIDSIHTDTHTKEYYYILKHSFLHL